MEREAQIDALLMEVNKLREEKEYLVKALSQMTVTLNRLLDRYVLVEEAGYGG